MHPDDAKGFLRFQKTTTTRQMDHDDTPLCCTTPKDKEPHVNALQQAKGFPMFPNNEDHTTNAPPRHTNMLRDSERQGTTCECTPTTQNDSYFPKDENHTMNAPRQHTNMLLDFERRGTTRECPPPTQKDYQRFQKTRAT